MYQLEPEKGPLFLLALLYSQINNRLETLKARAGLLDHAAVNEALHHRLRCERCALGALDLHGRLVATSASQQQQYHGENSFHVGERFRPAPAGCPTPGRVLAYWFEGTDVASGSGSDRCRSLGATQYSRIWTFL